MSKVLLINGSAHLKGNTAVALEEVAKVLQSEGVETEIVNLGTKPVRGCIGCDKCKENGNGRCIFNDDAANAISAQAAEADGFVIGAPVYYGVPDARWLCLLQRMLYSNGAAFRFKPVANIAVCRRGGASFAYQVLNMPWMMMNCPVATSQYWNIVYGNEPGETSEDREGMQTMRALARNMVWMLRGASENKHPELEPWQPMSFIGGAESKY